MSRVLQVRHGKHDLDHEQPYALSVVHGAFPVGKEGAHRHEMFMLSLQGLEE